MDIKAQDIRKTEEEQVIDDSYAIIRGSSYYGRSKCETKINQNV